MERSCLAQGKDPPRFVSGLRFYNSKIPLQLRLPLARYIDLLKLGELRILRIPKSQSFSKVSEVEVLSRKVGWVQFD